MADETKTRRKFVTRAAQVAVTAPAVSLLLSAATKPAMAAPAYQMATLDSVTTGPESTDAISQGSNFNPVNGQANQDDIFVQFNPGDDGSDDVTFA
jgi:hypothetical protein